MLSRAVLQAKLLRLMVPKGEGFPPTTAQAAVNWTQAYAQYASTAADVSTDLVAAANPMGFQNALAETFAGSRSARGFAEGLGKAFVAYWTGATFAVGIPPAPGIPYPTIGGLPVWSSETTSMVTAVDPSELIANMSAELSRNSTDAPQKSSNIAGILDAATRSGVLVTIVGTDISVPPLTNTVIAPIF